MKPLTNYRENMIFEKLFGILIMVASFIIVDCNLNAQEIPDNQLYEHERLFFNDLLVLRNHNVLLVRDRIHESRRKLFLLDSTNQVTDTMKTGAIIDMIAISDTSFFVNDFKYSVVVTIRNNRFVLSDIYLTLSDFYSAFGKLAFLNGKNWLFQKQNEENSCNRYDAIKQNEHLYCLQRLPLPDEMSTYKLRKKDSIKVLSITYPGMVYSLVRKKLKKVTIQNRDINIYTILSPKEIGKKRTDVIYGKDNIEWNNDSLFIYEKNSCSLFVFCPNNQFKLIASLKFPVDNQTNEGWKYILDVNTKTHYAVQRTKNSVIENLNNSGSKVSYYYQYKIYKIDILNRKLIEICKVGFDPICISTGLIYQMISNSQLSSSKILVYPLDSSKTLEKKIFIQ